MSLAPGFRLGAYEIIAPLGAGGMGEVYSARDTRLGRLVALKVLLPGGAADAAAAERFEREGRAASALTVLTDLTVRPCTSKSFQMR